MSAKAKKIPADRPLRSTEVLVAWRIAQAWRWLLAETATEAGEVNLKDEADRERWLNKSRRYSPAEVVRMFPPMDFTDRTWGNVEAALKSLKRSALYVVQYQRAPRQK